MANRGAREANAELRHRELVAAAHNERKSREEIDRLRAALAACERERDEAQAQRDEARLANARLMTEWDLLLSRLSETIKHRDLVRAEAERLRGVIGRIASATGNALNAGIEALSPLYGRAMRAINNEAVVALSPSSPAAPSSAAREAEADADIAAGRVSGPMTAEETIRHLRAPSSEYRRGYERAVADACHATRDVFFRAAQRRLDPTNIAVEAAIRSLLPAPREVGEAEVERVAEILDDYINNPGTVHRSILLVAARAVLAAQGEGRGK